MQVARLRNVARHTVQGLVAAVVVFMAAWDAYICLRLRPDLPSVVINLSFWLLPILIPFVATGRWWRSFALGTVVAFSLQRLHWLKWHYMEQTWTAADLRFLTAAANWSLIWQYPETLVYLVTGTAMLILSWVMIPRGIRAGAKARASAAVLALALAGGVVQWRDQHPFDPFGFNLYGHFASLVYSLSTLDYQPPVVIGSSALFVARAAQLADRPALPAPATPDIVVWLQESTMDLRVLDLPSAQLPALAMYEPDAHTRALGPLRVHSWGGSTWLSEFALLTGLSHEDFGPSGNGVYYTVTPRLRSSLPHLLKRYGYRAIALSGVPKTLYNMEAAQRDLGFDEVLNPLDFPEWGGKSLADHLIGDDELGGYARQILARTTGQPVLLFVLSMMQHGPYDSRHAVGFGLDRAGLRRDHAARVSDYVERMVATDVAARAFSAQLLAGPRPVVHAYFGDHQPNLDGPLPYVAEPTNPRYLTEYVIKTNFAGLASPRAAQPLDISYLGAAILEAAGLPLGPLFDANRRMRQLCEGRLTDCPDRALTNSYRAHLYHDLQAAQLR